MAVYIFSEPFALVTLGGILPLREYSGDVLSSGRDHPCTSLVSELVGLAGRATRLAAWASSAGLLCRKPTEEATPICVPVSRPIQFSGGLLRRQAAKLLLSGTGRRPPGSVSIARNLKEMKRAPSNDAGFSRFPEPR